MTNVPERLSRLFAVSAAVALLLGLPSFGQGDADPQPVADNEWNTTTGDWMTGASWTVGVPLNTQLVVVDNGGTAEVGAGDAAAADLLSLAYERPGLGGLGGNLTMTGGTLTTTTTVVGERRTANFLHSGGTHSTDTLLLGEYQHAGYGNDGVGIYTMSGTADVDVSSDLIVGKANASTVNVNGGTLDAGFIAIGTTAGAQNGFLRQVVQTAGIVTAGGMHVGAGYVGGNSQRYTISGGLLDVNGDVRVPTWTAADARMVQSGGTVDVSGTLTLGDTQGNAAQPGPGYYDMSGGRLIVGGTLQVGRNRDGHFENDGGTVELASLQVAPFRIYTTPIETADYTQLAGSTTVSGAVTVGGELYRGPFTPGLLDIQDGTFAGGDLTIGYSGSGTLLMQGGSATFTGNALVGRHYHPGTGSSGDGLVDLRAGTLQITGNVTLGLESTTHGEIAVSGGQLIVGGALTDGNGGDMLLSVVGADSAGISFDSITLDSASTVFSVRPVGNAIETIRVTNGVSLSNITLLVDLPGGYVPPTGGTTFDLIDGLTVIDSSVTTLTTDWRASYEIVAGGAGQILRLTVIPEPSAGLLVAAGLAVLLRRRRLG